MSDLAARYAEVCARVQAAAGAAESARPVTLIAVSKTVEPARIEDLYRLGHRDFGENYAQELVAKATTFARAGYCGHPLAFYRASADEQSEGRDSVWSTRSTRSTRPDSGANSLSVGAKLAMPSKGCKFSVEVNIDAEEGKAGTTPAEAPALARELASLEEIDLRGLMCVPRPRDLATESAALRAKFAELRELGRQCGGAGELSMGMSGDFELALAEGATHVRVGTALFGSRS